MYDLLLAFNGCTVFAAPGELSVKSELGSLGVGRLLLLIGCQCLQARPCKGGETYERKNLIRAVN